MPILEVIGSVQPEMRLEPVQADRGSGALLLCGMKPMKYHYRPAFNVAVYGAAEARADRYWKNRLRGDNGDKQAKAFLRGIPH